MARAAKFTDEQKFQIALELIAGKLSHAEISRKYDISSTYAYKLKDRALEVLREGIGWPAGRPAAIRTWTPLREAETASIVTAPPRTLRPCR